MDVSKILKINPKRRESEKKEKNHDEWGNRHTHWIRFNELLFKIHTHHFWRWMRLIRQKQNNWFECASDPMWYCRKKDENFSFPNDRQIESKEKKRKKIQHMPRKSKKTSIKILIHPDAHTKNTYPHTHKLLLIITHAYTK